MRPDRHLRKEHPCPRCPSGLLGAGRIGKVHATAIATTPNAEVVAVADAFPDPANEGRVRARRGRPDDRRDHVGRRCRCGLHHHADRSACRPDRGRRRVPARRSSARSRSTSRSSACVECLAWRWRRPPGVPLMVGFNRRFDSRTSRPSAQADRRRPRSGRSRSLDHRLARPRPRPRSPYIERLGRPLSAT